MFGKRPSHSASVVQLSKMFADMSQKGTISYFSEEEFVTIIEYYLSNQQTKNAFKAAESALLQHSYNHIFYLKKAEILLKMNAHNSAYESIEHAEILSPKNLDIQLLKASILKRLGQGNKAHQLLRSLKQEASSEQLSEVYMAMASVYEEAGQYQSMQDVLQKAILQNPHQQKAYDKLWLATELSNNYKASVQFHNKVIDVHPYSHKAWFNKGMAHYSLEELEEAEDAFEFAYIITATYSNAYKYRIEVLLEMKSYAKVISCALEALEQLEGDTWLMNKIGFCYEQLNKLEDAKLYYLMALKTDSNNFESHLMLGALLGKQGKLQQAMTCIEKAEQLEESNEEVWFAKAQIFEKLEDREEASTYFNKAIGQAPDITKYWAAYITFLIKIDAHELAIAVIEEARMYADHSVLDYCESACLFKMGLRKEAINKLATALTTAFEAYKLLFEVEPSLENDTMIRSVIEAYK